jgi:hypothetical protein
LEFGGQEDELRLGADGQNGRFQFEGVLSQLLQGPMYGNFNKNSSGGSAKEVKHTLRASAMTYVVSKQRIRIGRCYRE